MPNFFYIFLIASLINILFFILAYILKTDKLTDISYSITFISLIMYQLSYSTLNIVNITLSCMIFLWALRLGSFLFIRILKIGKDFRFDNIRISFFKFLFFWVFQAISVIIILLPSLFLIQLDIYFNLFSLVGIIIWLVGLTIETFADFQKFFFKLNPKNNNKWIDSGLWKYSRHPNYFGEILIWLGVYLYSMFYLDSCVLIFSIISPLYVSFLLLYISGVPMLEKNADKKWGKNKEYINYKNRTNLIIPWKN